MNIFEEDGVTREMAARLVGEFRGQPLDFFGAMRSRLADRAVREWTLDQVGGGPFGDCDREAFAPLHRLLVEAEERARCEIPTFSLDEMIAAGRELVFEQDAVNEQRLAEEYMRTMEDSGIGIGLN